MLPLLDQREPFIPTQAEAEIAGEAVTKLQAIALAGMDIKIRVTEQPDLVVPLPARAVKMIVSFLQTMADRKAVSMIPHAAEITTKQAADFLNVSRPYLIGLISKGEIPHRMVGTHRRVLMSDLIAYKEKSETARAAAIKEMVVLSQKYNLP